MSHLSKFTQCTHDVILTVECSGHSTKFTTNHIFVHPCISGDFYFVDGCRFSFHHVNFEIDGVVLDGNFNGLNIEKQVSLIGI